jgi:hypothetical protein
MIILGAEMTIDNHAEKAKWRMVKDVIVNQLPDDMQESWREHGFDGIFSTAPEYFGMTRMYRSKNSWVTFEFTEQEWTMFSLRWL